MSTQYGNNWAKTPVRNTFSGQHASPSALSHQSSGGSTLSAAGFISSRLRLPPPAGLDEEGQPHRSLHLYPPQNDSEAYSQLLSTRLGVQLYEELRDSNRSIGEAVSEITRLSKETGMLYKENRELREARGASTL